MSLPSIPGIKNFQFKSSEHLSLALARCLTSATGLNEFMESILPYIGSLFGTEKVSLVDYYEHTNHFELLYFEGYAAGARYQLQRCLSEMELRRALQQREPYISSRNDQWTLLPCYFRDILEAVLVIERTLRPLISEREREAARLISRFIGLLMSSTRLEINRDQLRDLNDLNRARQIQLNFLPKEAPRASGCEVYGFNTSSDLVGGDYFDYFDDLEDSVRCVLADACGHGLAAALIMSNFRGLLRSQVLRQREIQHLFNILNDQIHFDDDLIQYLTSIFLRFDERTKQLEYLNAGHYEPIVLGRNGTVRTLPGGGPPLGMFQSSKYPLGRVQLEPGDLITLFTDGLVDIQNHEGEYFGIEGVVNQVRDIRSLPLKEAAERVLERARVFSGKNSFEDDATVFLMRIH